MAPLIPLTHPWHPCRERRGGEGAGEDLYLRDSIQDQRPDHDLAGWAFPDEGNRLAPNLRKRDIVIVDALRKLHICAKVEVGMFERCFIRGG